jgi:hypothetical protein
MEGRVGQLGVDAAQRQALALQVRADRLGVGIGDQGVHPHQHLAGAHGVALLHQDFLDDARFGGLDDLHVTLRHQLAFGDGDDVEAADDRPHGQQHQQHEQRPQDLAAERVRARCLQAQERWRKIECAGRRFVRGFFHDASLILVVKACRNRREPVPACGPCTFTSAS